jgi:hypothetical protein
VLFEDTGWCKLPKLVAYHVFGDENRDEGASVMNIESMPHEIGGNRRAARPGFDRLLDIVLVEFVDFLEEFPLDERTFFEGACHDKLFLFAALHDETVALFAFCAGLEALGKLTPWAHRMMASATALALTLSTTHRVINRVHRHTASLRTHAEPAGTTSFSADDIDVLDVANLTDCCVALFIDAAQFAGCQFQEGITAFTVAQNSLRSGTADNLSTLARDQFDIVDRESERNRLERKGVADRWLCLFTRCNLESNGQTAGSQDVGLLTIRILDECETSAAVRIVFDRDDLGDGITTAALKIDDAIFLFMTTAAMARGFAAHVVATTGAVLAFNKGFLRLALGDLLEGRECLEALGRRQRAKGF